MSLSGRTEPELPTIWTVGHSILPIGEFLALLRGHDIEMVLDVRRYPASRRHPQFNAGALAQALQEAGIGYLSLPDLGGRRESRPDSPNTAWRNASFRGYADYMETDLFQQAIQRVVEIARTQRAALLCAEALWWRCHRALLADYMKALGWNVLHILSPTTSEPHPYTAAAHIVAGRLSYRKSDEFSQGQFGLQ